MAKLKRQHEEQKQMYANEQEVKTPPDKDDDKCTMPSTASASSDQVPQQDE